MNNNKVYIFLVLLLFKGSLITSSSISILIRKIPAALKSTKITAHALLAGQQVRTLSDETFPSKPYESAKDYYRNKHQDFAALVQASKILTNEFSLDSRVPKLKIKLCSLFIPDHLTDSADGLLLKKAVEDQKYNINIKNEISLVCTQIDGQIRELKDRIDKNENLLKHLPLAMNPSKVEYNQFLQDFSKHILKNKLDDQALVKELKNTFNKLIKKKIFMQVFRDGEEFKKISEIMKKGLGHHKAEYRCGYISEDEYQEKNKNIKKLNDYLQQEAGHDDFWNKE